jgi:hypothetical protein
MRNKKMKTANVKVRLKDIRQGVTIYISHPIYGIEHLIVSSKPKVSKTTGALFFSATRLFDNGLIVHDTLESIRDSGICGGNSYNGRRTFFKLKHAEEWQRKSLKDPKFLAIHKRHEEMNRDLDDMEDYYHPWGDDDRHGWGD